MVEDAFIITGGSRLMNKNNNQQYPPVLCLGVNIVNNKLYKDLKNHIKIHIVQNPWNSITLVSTFNSLEISPLKSWVCIVESSF